MVAGARRSLSPMSSRDSRSVFRRRPRTRVSIAGNGICAARPHARPRLAVAAADSGTRRRARPMRALSHREHGRCHARVYGRSGCGPSMPGVRRGRPSHRRDRRCHLRRRTRGRVSRVSAFARGRPRLGRSGVGGGPDPDDDATSARMAESRRTPTSPSRRPSDRPRRTGSARFTWNVTWSPGPGATHIRCR